MTAGASSETQKSSNWLQLPGSEIPCCPQVFIPDITLHKGTLAMLHCFQLKRGVGQSQRVLQPLQGMRMCKTQIMSVLSPFYVDFEDTKFFSVLPCPTKGSAHTFQNINHNCPATESILWHYTHGNISPRVSHNCFPFLLQPYQKKSICRNLSGCTPLRGSRR